MDFKQHLPIFKCINLRNLSVFSNLKIREKRNALSRAFPDLQVTVLTLFRFCSNLGLFLLNINTAFSIVIVTLMLELQNSGHQTRKLPKVVKFTP